MDRQLSFDDGKGNAGKIAWNSTPLVKGDKHYIFEGKITQGRLRNLEPGADVVMKVIRSSVYKTGVKFRDEDIKVQEKAREIVAEFNSAALVGYQVSSIVGALAKSDGNYRNNEGSTCIVKGEEVLIEEKIGGKFEKFNSNSGWYKGDCILPEFISHWSWVNSNGKYLLCDLQGHKGSGDTFEFTGPAIHSEHKGRFGASDLGPAGVQKWFEVHNCNFLCKFNKINHEKPDSSSRKSKISTTKKTVYSHGDNSST